MDTGYIPVLDSVATATVCVVGSVAGAYLANLRVKYEGTAEEKSLQKKRGFWLSVVIGGVTGLIISPVVFDHVVSRYVPNVSTSLLFAGSALLGSASPALAKIARRKLIEQAESYRTDRG